MTCCCMLLLLVMVVRGRPPRRHLRFSFALNCAREYLLKVLTELLRLLWLQSVWAVEVNNVDGRQEEVIGCCLFSLKTRLQG